MELNKVNAWGKSYSWKLECKVTNYVYSRKLDLEKIKDLKYLLEGI